MFKDKSGYSLLPGDYIVYGHALGRCAGLRYGMVLEVVPNTTEYYPDTGGDQEFKLKVIGVDDDWASRAPALLSKPSHLSFGSRVLGVQTDQVPEAIRNLLLGYGK